jgi:hypothetical protein
MSGRTKALLTAAVFAVAIPAAAQAPAPAPVTAAFDGHYAGVSAHVSKSTAGSRQCPRVHTPESLTITNGAVHSGPRERWTGTVTPQGSVTLRNKLSMRVDAQIDPQGMISGRYHGPACAVDYVWQKQPG